MRLGAVLLALAALIPLEMAPAGAAPKPQGPMQICTAQWLSLRDGGDLHGQTYPSFIRLCIQGGTTDWGSPGGSISQSYRASARTGPVKAASSKTASSGGNRMKMCGARWQALKAANATNGQTWRQFSSQCLRTH